MELYSHEFFFIILHKIELITHQVNNRIELAMLFAEKEMHIEAKQ